MALVVGVRARRGGYVSRPRRHSKTGPNRLYHAKGLRPMVAGTGHERRHVTAICHWKVQCRGRAKMAHNGQEKQITN